MTFGRSRRGNPARARSPGAAADVAAQRLKAIDKAARDGNSWEFAKFLELIPDSKVSLADREEEFMTAKEVRLAKRAGFPSKGGGKGKDKGTEKGKSKQSEAYGERWAEGAGAKKGKSKK